MSVLALVVGVRARCPCHVLACFLVVLPLASFAQAGESDHQPRGISFGHLKLLPRYEQQHTLMDNTLRTERDERRDERIDFLPAIRLDFEPDSFVSLSADYEFGWHEYLRNEARDYLSHSASASLDVRFPDVEDVRLSLKDVYYQSGNIAPLETEMLAFTRFHTNEASATLTARLEKFRLKSSFSSGLTDYFSRTDAASDVTLLSPLGEVAYEVLRKRVRTFGRYQFARNLFRTDGGNDFDTHTFSAGIQGEYGKLKYDVGAGYRLVMLRGTGERSKGPAFDAALSYAPHSRVEFSVRASREVLAGVQSGAATVTDIQAKAVFRPLERMEITAVYARNESVRQTEKVISTACEVGLTYHLVRFTTFEVAFDRSIQESNGATGSFSLNQLRAGFILKW